MKRRRRIRCRRGVKIETNNGDVTENLPEEPVEKLLEPFSKEQCRSWHIRKNVFWLRLEYHTETLIKEDCGQEGVERAEKEIGNRVTSLTIAMLVLFPRLQPFVMRLDKRRGCGFPRYARKIFVRKAFGDGNRTGKPKGFALFVYKSIDSAKKALEEPHKIFEGHTLNVQKAIDGPKPVKGGFGAGGGHQHHHQGSGAKGSLMSPSGPEDLGAAENPHGSGIWESGEVQGNTMWCIHKWVKAEGRNKVVDPTWARVTSCQSQIPTLDPVNLLFWTLMPDSSDVPSQSLQK
ncbi:UBP1-associated protein 2A-like protein [Tanacetum coccineum]|uniref:UBP1-associated protein 2A-like protein n=1 Tax=Tanacetum coccineum TaxID=301880 RepID=A0ABQ4YA08_9ASTR